MVLLGLALGVLLSAITSPDVLQGVSMDGPLKVALEPFRAHWYENYISHPKAITVVLYDKPSPTNAP